MNFINRIMSFSDDNRAQALIAAIFIILGLSLFGLIGVSLLGMQTMGSGTETLQSLRAFLIARAGIEWYAQRLADADISWVDTAVQTGPFGGGWFQIEVLSSGDGYKKIESKGFISAFNGNAARSLEVEIYQLPFASNLAFFEGVARTSALSITSSAIDGDAFVNGNADCSSVTKTNGKIYVPNLKTVSGLGTKGQNWEDLDPPTNAPTIPRFDKSYYQTLITDYNQRIDSALGSSTQDLTLSGTITLNGNTRECNRDIFISGTCTISGNGYIVAGRNAYLAYSNPSNLTITPNGGNIVILAGRNMYIPSVTTGTRNIKVNPGVIFYAENSGNDLMRIQRASSTFIDGALIMANKRIDVQAGAELNNSILLLNSSAGSPLLITGSTTRVSGNVISLGNGNPSLDIRSGASVTGLVYQRGPGNTGYTRIDGNSNIRGALIAYRFRGNSLGPANIIYDESVIASRDNFGNLLPPVKGFTAYVSYVPNSWDGL